MFILINKESWKIYLKQHHHFNITHIYDTHRLITSSITKAIASWYNRVDLATAHLTMCYFWSYPFTSRCNFLYSLSDCYRSWNWVKNVRRWYTMKNVFKKISSFICSTSKVNFTASFYYFSLSFPSYKFIFRLFF